jgi:hypothetical protein
MFTAFANQNQFDPDAGAFINATGIGGIEAVAINNLVNQLKTVGLWGKFNAMYPFVGGTAYTHQFNLINPQDSNAAYRITFGGTVTHSSGGIKGNGTNGYGNTYLTPAAAGGGQNNSHIGLYCTVIPTGRAGTDMGATTNQATSALAINVRNPSNVFNTTHNNAVFAGPANTTGGMFLITRSVSTEYRRYKNTTETTTVVNSATVSTTPIAICAWNNNGAFGNFQDRTYAFASIGYSLTSAEVTNLYNIIQTFQITLGRAV